MTSAQERESFLASGLPLLVATAVGKSYGEREVLKDISLSVRSGERVALTGPSGSGKSTLLNCLGGLDRLDRGAIELAGRRLDRMTSVELARMRRTSVGTVFQFFHLLPTLTAQENVELPLQLLGVGWRERRTRAMELLARVGLVPRAEALPGQLSGGEMQRVALARAVIHRPAVLLADEPTGSLDTASGEAVLQLLRELSEESGAALLLVTHSAEAAAICHREIRLRDGQIEAEGRLAG
jgi:putative ABC transport system ATP-binding protein